MINLDRSASLGLLVLRVGAGGLMAFGHGFVKLQSFAEKSETFADPIGVGSVASLALAVFAEFFCAIAVALGLFTRLAAVPLLLTMLVAALIVHADDPFARKELALLYAVPFLTLILTGGGAYSLDRVLGRGGSKGAKKRRT